MSSYAVSGMVMYISTTSSFLRYIELEQAIEKIAKDIM